MGGKKKAKTTPPQENTHHPPNSTNPINSPNSTNSTNSSDAAAGQTLDALRQAIEGRAAFPPWPEHGLPEETSRQTIEQALAAGHHLHLTYYAASTNRLTDRLVEPYRLEWRGDTPYLIAFCHHAQSERMFRLDRIREVEPIATE